MQPYGSMLADLLDSGVHVLVFAGEAEATKVDVVVFATGFRQAVDFIDPAVV